MHQTMPSNTRTIVLEDLLGNEVRLILWGNRAVEFDADGVRAMGAKEPVIAIFVGMLPKMAFGIRGLSGSSPCRWYIDEDVPDINFFRKSLGDQFTPLASYDASAPGALVSRVHEAPVDKTVQELDDLDPFEDMEKRFFCTITVSRLDSEQRWWFLSCSVCLRSARHNGYQYKCSEETCSSIEADLTYSVSVFGTDGTTEAEFIMFDRVAAGAVGKPLMTLLRQKYRGCTTVDDLARAARHDMSTPSEITRLVGKKYRLLVSISKKWKTRSNTIGKLAFQVNRIEETFKPELPPSVFGVVSGTPEASSSGAASGSHLPALSPVNWPGSQTPHAHGSPVRQTPAAIVKIGPSTTARSSAPKRGARRSLFNTPSKEQPKPVKETTEGHVSDGDSAKEAVVEVVASHTENKYNPALSQNNKAAIRDKDEVQRTKRLKKNKQ